MTSGLCAARTGWPLGSAGATMALLVALAGPAGAGEKKAPPAPQQPRGLERLLADMGRPPDSTERVGAACGELTVLTWSPGRRGGGGTRAVLVDGRVESLRELSPGRPPLPEDGQRLVEGRP